ncbi:putative mitochondrial hypothetical protein [Leptomonas pyrrhocoris]|uniref:Uncharacterized protein n=1 Tax=Leptomonas pyrrhocoris TaxID=157538 RepID=A0A0M9G9F2_LEPPY|nr:putative mitochondrial hypothetical protein [Leptomonas pyrrhocoris]KPA85299.1 putative mitochondrial hypothetical protein [Leptomonas pyrrhocoris]|eukprot:XP_015663738.1 putative mitochondrial hypothetical protein [Leptomonas pyrrhocoris]
MRRQISVQGEKYCSVGTRSKLRCCRYLVPTVFSSSPQAALRTSRRSISVGAPPPFYTDGREAEAPSAAPPSFASPAIHAQQENPWMSSSSAARVAAPFSPQEVKALVFPLLPCVPRSPPSPNRSTGFLPQCITVSALLRPLPKSLRSYMEKYQRSPSSDGELKCEVRGGKRETGSVERNAFAATLMASGVGAYLVDHFPEEVVIFMPGGRLARKEAPPSTTATQGETSSASSTGADGKTASCMNAVSEKKTEDTSSPSSTEEEGTTNRPVTAPEKASEGSTGLRSPATGTAPPPPPQPVGSRERYGNITGAPAFFGAPSVGTSGGAPLSPSASSLDKVADDVRSNPAAVPLRSTIQMMDVLVEYIPTFYTPVDEIAPMMPSNIQQLYADSSFRFFLKRFKHYIDIRSTFSVSEVRLRSTFNHPKRGMADARFRTGGTASVESSPTANQLRRPPRNSEANLIGLIAPQVPKAFTPLAEVLQEIAPIVSRHPAFDPRLGVTGILGKYPEYFQVVDGRLRARPYREAPNSLRDLDCDSSPLPEIFAKVWTCVEAAAAGKDYAEPAEKAAATVSTGRLYGLLSAAEKAAVKQKCRSFPTFLRLHGKALVVSVDKMRVYKFIPEHEACTDTLLNERLRMNSLDPNDPILKIPAAMAPEANAEWAVRELYDALPLMQCAELSEVLSLVPPAVRDALPKAVSDVRLLLEQYGDYFAIWPYPDDESVIVVRRARVEEPVLDKAEIVRMVVPLIPQGGTTLTSLRTRAPLVLQRYFYRHGTVATLGAMKDMFAIAGDRIVRLM